MTDPYRDTHPAERTGLPRWVKVAGIIVAVVALLFIVMNLVGGSGGMGHNVPDHSGDAADTADTVPAVWQSAEPDGHTPPPGAHG